MNFWLQFIFTHILLSEIIIRIVDGLMNFLWNYFDETYNWISWIYILCWYYFSWPVQGSDEFKCIFCNTCRSSSISSLIFDKSLFFQNSIFLYFSICDSYNFISLYPLSIRRNLSYSSNIHINPFLSTL